jgi:prophage regulatory protein
VEDNADLLKRADILGLLDIDPATLWRWRKSGNFPAPIKLTRGNLRWRKKDVTEWLESRRVSDVPLMQEGSK